MLLITVIICGFLLAVYTGLLGYYRMHWLAIKENLPGTKGSAFITVVVPARNEAANIAVLFKSLKEQTYAAELFEVIMIDDHSEDDTLLIAKEHKGYNFKLLELKDFLEGNNVSYKKQAIAAAIKVARGEIIVTTDADCMVPKQWLQRIAEHYAQTNFSLLAMPVLISPAASLLQKFQCLDFMMLQGITGSGIAARLHYMCNGANLAYTRKAFEEVGGFAGIDNIASGDDMLLMHKIAQNHPGKIDFLKSAFVIVRTAPAAGLKAFIQQRIRWASKSDKYTDKALLPVMILVFAVNLLIFLLFCYSVFIPQAMLWNKPVFGYLVITILIKIAAELLLLWPVSRFFDRRKLLPWFIFFQPFHIMYTLIAGFLGKFGTYSWKGRKVK